MGHEHLNEFMAALPPALDRLNGADMKSVVKAIRLQTAQAIKAGVLPPDTKLSVRCTDYKHVYVEITEWKGALFTDAYLAHLLDPKGTPWDPGHWDHRETLVETPGMTYGHKYFTRAVNEALYDLRRIANRHNYDRSDIQTDYFDVGYYLDTTANPAYAAQREAIELERNPAYGEKLARALIAAQTLGAKCVRSIGGRHGINACGEWSLDRLLRVADRANGRPVAYDKSRRGWFPTDEVKTWHNGVVKTLAEIAEIEAS
jgi:hypothetical protein